MIKRTSFKILIPIILTVLLFQSGCSVVNTVKDQTVGIWDQKVNNSQHIALAQENTEPADSESIETIQASLKDVYNQVLPSVVNIKVTQNLEQAITQDNRNLPFPFPFQLPDNGEPFTRSGLGSGFVWDDEGHIVTNNHVVETADKITVTFHDGTSLDGEVVGTDKDSDLAVVKVERASELLKPIQLADSTSVEVGQLVSAIGNPFGLDGTMTFGIVSALGRSLPVNRSQILGSSYTIPDVIQTDAPINPGNSGGVLVDMDGKLVGVPTAIESYSGVNAGVGFVIPSIIVEKVIPVLIKQGYFEHPWIGVSGTTLVSDIAKRMDLPEDQRGVLVVDVVPDSPAEKAGLLGSDRVAEIDGQEVRFGGDVITQIDKQAIKDFEDLTAYLARFTEAGQKVSLTVIRDGSEEALDLTLSVRPAEQQEVKAPQSNRNGNAWLGIQGTDLSGEIAEAMELSPDQTGVLIQQVFEGSPADLAGLRGSFKSVNINGQPVLIGGDIITALENAKIDTMAEFQKVLSDYQPGDDVTLEILRNGQTVDINITLGEGN
jgi:S1-C subfamily serine protease